MVKNSQNFQIMCVLLCIPPQNFNRQEFNKAQRVPAEKPSKFRLTAIERWVKWDLFQYLYSKAFKMRSGRNKNSDRLNLGSSFVKKA